jgi:phage shock protein A
MDGEREYAVHLVMEAKRLKKTIEEKRQSREKWENRVDLARKSGRKDLEQAAGKEAASLDFEIQQLEVEETSLLKEVEEAKKSWKRARITEGLSVDAEALALSLEEMAGPADPDGEELEKIKKEADAESALEELKREMGLDK